jgi:hypothetical protein
MESSLGWGSIRRRRCKDLIWKSSRCALPPPLLMSYEYNNPLYPYAHYPPYPPYQYRLPDDDPFLQAQAAHSHQNLDSFSQWYPFDLPNNFNNPATSSPPPPPVPVPTPPTLTNPGVTGPPMHHMLSLAGSLDTQTGIFYRTPEHPRLRTAQACEKCRTRKAKVHLP